MLALSRLVVLPAGDSVHSVFQVCAVPRLYVAVDLLSARGLRQRQVAVATGSSGHNHSPRPSGPQPSPCHLHLVKELLSLNEAPHIEGTENTVILLTQYFGS